MVYRAHSYKFFYSLPYADYFQPANFRMFTGKKSDKCDRTKIEVELAGGAIERALVRKTEALRPQMQKTGAKRAKRCRND